MQKTCECGHPMEIRLRKVIYARAVEVDNVPVYMCPHCRRISILPEIKEDLARLIRDLGLEPERNAIDFADVSEWAYLIAQATDESRMHEPIQQLIADRVDQLLDLMLLARSLEDVAWEAELRGRLSQITRPVLAS
ncbi:MAG: hypothetical protein BAA02_15035 [Paenibacillaceae bacterium ZCTH02-B3]|nr:MAG: hypothetical protein BAA02_15035 [Paenibacillaceae bacterium ZCTH02-B3]